MPGRLLGIPFGDDSLGMAICSHFLFLYTGHLSLDFHIRSIKEMLRVVGEVRIFPPVDIDGNQSSCAGSIIKKLEKKEYIVKVLKVRYESQRGGNKMLKINKRH